MHDRAGRYLLVEETKSAAAGLLALPGGRLRPDESLEVAAAREAHEETGLEVEITSLVGIFHFPRTVEHTYGLALVFAASAADGVPRPSTEHPRSEWLTRDEIEQRSTNGEIRGTYVAEAVRMFEDGEPLEPSTITVVRPIPAGT